jgi:hypothetical protein
MDDWKQHAYPLQLVTIELQGTRHSDMASILSQLDKVRARILAGALAGEESDDDFGYRFAVSSPAESVFPEPASYL